MGERPSRAMLDKPSTYKDPDNYPAITVHQPYAGLIWLAGMGELGKDIEVRIKRITYRGQLVIGAGKRVDPDAYERVRKLLVGGGIMKLADYEAACGASMTGKAVALMEIAHCRPMAEDDRERSFISPQFETRDQFAWEAGTIAALNPFPTTGAQGFFRVRRELVDNAIRRQTTREQRDRVWEALKKRRELVCDCGSKLPRHLAEAMNDSPNASHDCRCGKRYVVRRNKFVVVEVAATKDVDHG